jgi:hypothetical protein
MKTKKVSSAAPLILVLIAVCASVSANAAACFRIFDATAYSGKPDLAALGIQHLTLVVPARWWKGAGADDNSLREATKAGTAPILKNSDPVVIDLELPLTSNNPASEGNIAKYVKTIDWMRDAGYSKPLSFYGSLPVRDYWSAVKGGPPFQQWQRENDRLAPIVAKVEALYPSLYTFYPNQQGWVAYAAGNISEAKRIGRGRPVYPFLWPQYHDSAGALAHHEIPADYWLLQLRTMREHADGLVIWGGWDFDKKAPLQWDDNAPWWQATRKFMAETRNMCPPGAMNTP